MANVVIGTAVSLGLGMLSRALTPTQYVYNQQETGKLDDISTRKAGMGWSLDRHYGKTIVKSCPIFWALPKIDRPETASTTERTGGGKGGGGGGTVTTTETVQHRYYGTFAFAIGDGYPNGVGDIVKIKFNDEVWYNTQGETVGTEELNNFRLTENLEIKKGGVSQGPSNIMQQFEDFDRIHFSGLAYCVIQDLPLAPFGNELPGQIDVELFGIAEVGDSLTAVVRDAMEQVGLQAGTDYRELEITRNLIGATMKQDGSSVKSFLDDIMQVHFLISYLDAEGRICINEERLGNVVVQPRTVTYEDLGAGEPTSDINEPYTETIVSQKELPSEVSLSFTNVEDGYSGGTESWNRPIAKHHRPQSLSSGLVLTPGQAREFCWRYLGLMYDQRNRYTFKFAPNIALQLFSGQFLNVPLYPGDPATTFQINQVTIGADLTGEVSATLFNGEAFSGVPSIARSRCQIYNGSPLQLQPNITAVPVVRADGVLLVEGTDYSVDYANGVITLTGVANGVQVCVDYQSEVNDTIDDYRPEDEFPFYGEPVATILDIHRVNATDPPCLYLAITPDPAYNAVGDTLIFASIDDSPFTQVGTAIGATTTGELVGSLPLSEGLQPGETVGIVLDRGFLDPLTEIQFEANQLILLVGEEQISVKDVTLTDELTYTIGNFKRGHNGTIAAAHSSGTPITVLRGPGQVIRLNGGSGLIDKVLSIKLVPVGFTLESIVSVATITVRGNYYRPYRPSELDSVKDQSGNITMVWQGNNTGLEALVPFEFDVVIPDATPERVFTVGTNSLTYTVAQQIEDFGSVQLTLDVIIYQLSKEYGLAAGINTDRGYGLEATISPVLGVLLPVVEGFSPTQGEFGVAISIFGFGFTGATGAAIAGEPISDFVVVDDNTITGTVADETTTGKVSVTNATGTGFSLTDFVVVDNSDYMLKSVYDPDENNIVNNAQKVNGIDTAGESKYYGTNEAGEPGFHELSTGAEWGEIEGEIRDQVDLQDRFDRIRRYTNLIGNVTIPSVGNTVTVTLEDPDGFAPGVPVCLFRTDTVGSGEFGYAQMLCIGRTGNTLTLERDSIGLVTQTSFLDGDIIAPIVDREVNIYGGLSLIEGVTFKAKNIESISATKILNLGSEYFQFLTPTSASVAVRLPPVTLNDYFEGEIINAGNGDNALVVQESDSTPVITLSTAEIVRSIYYYWDGSIWRIFERNVYG
jgi:hypothetical protein